MSRCTSSFPFTLATFPLRSALGCMNMTKNSGGIDGYIGKGFNAHHNAAKAVPSRFGKPAKT
jgi:hypothetical protein